MKKTTIDLPDELMLETKLRAVAQGRPLEELVAEFIRQGLGHPVAPGAGDASAKVLLRMAPDGLPVIPCRAEAPATRSSVAELLALEQRILAGHADGHGRDLV